MSPFNNQLSAAGETLHKIKEGAGRDLRPNLIHLPCFRDGEIEARGVKWLAYDPRANLLSRVGVKGPGASWLLVIAEHLHWPVLPTLLKLKPVRANWKRAVSTDMKSKHLLFLKSVNLLHLKTSLVSKQPQLSWYSMPVLKEISSESICIYSASLKSI